MEDRSENESAPATPARAADARQQPAAKLKKFCLLEAFMSLRKSPACEQLRRRSWPSHSGLVVVMV